MIVYILALFTILSSFIIPITEIDKALEPGYNKYIEFINNNCKDKTKLFNPPQKYIIFGNLDEGKIGETTRYTFKYKIIMSSSYWWKRSNDMNNITLYHELSHAILRLDHSKDPNNYMFAYDEGYNIKDIEQQIIADIKRVCDN